MKIEIVIPEGRTEGSHIKVDGREIAGVTAIKLDLNGNSSVPDLSLTLAESNDGKIAKVKHVWLHHDFDVDNGPPPMKFSGPLKTTDGETIGED